MTIKHIGKTILCVLLESQVKRLRKRHEIKIVAVIGSVGKTSTKLAIAKMLNHSQPVIYQDGNYNDRLTVPLVLFGRTEPSIFNVLAWFKILLANERAIRSQYPYKIAVLELGTDGPGQLVAFEYLHPDITVVTSIAAEHMEYFGTLNAVAEEELVPLGFSKQALLNVDDIPHKYLPDINYLSYGSKEQATYWLSKREQTNLQGQELVINDGDESLVLQTVLLGMQGAKAVMAAAVVGKQLGYSDESITAGIAQVTPVAGRSQVLPGLNQSLLIDDTYNASPIAVRAALEVLYSVEAPQRIAILGTMNELGTISNDEHIAIGAYCDSTKLDLVVTIGDVAEEYLAPAAQKAGCTVMSFTSPYEAGAYVRDQLKPGAVVLAKGSQNGVFSEEALKFLLQNPADKSKLVRQSAHWLGIKKSQFPENVPAP
ncbi:MAG: Mur ligase middle domain protein [Candidatus Saccharibacteria bacterium]|nr:Mur ligase middle domain protein [Candidatus Saccharibacteria bacterium]